MLVKASYMNVSIEEKLDQRFSHERCIAHRAKTRIKLNMISEQREGSAIGASHKLVAWTKLERVAWVGKIITRMPGSCCNIGTYTTYTRTVRRQKFSYGAVL